MPMPGLLPRRSGAEARWSVLITLPGDGHVVEVCEPLI